jgi:hypothetical protein
MSSNSDPLKESDEIRYQIILTRLDVVRRIDAINSTIRNRISALKESAMQRLQDVKDEISVSRQAQRRPWWVLAVSIGAGFLIRRQFKLGDVPCVHQSVLDSTNSSSYLYPRGQPAPTLKAKVDLRPELGRVASFVVDLGVHALLRLITEMREQRKINRVEGPDTESRNCQ